MDTTPQPLKKAPEAGVSAPAKSQDRTLAGPSGKVCTCTKEAAVSHPLTARQYAALEIYKTLMMAVPTMANEVQQGNLTFCVRAADRFLAFERATPTKE